MLIRCKKCKLYFAAADEMDTKCPNCGYSNAISLKANRCINCGRLLPEGLNDFCDDICKVNYENREKVYDLVPYTAKNIVLRNYVMRIEKYNSKHHTNLSYGQYVSLFEGGKKKHDNRRSKKRTE